MKTRLFPFFVLSLLPILLMGLTAGAQVLSPSATPGYDAEKASHISFAPAAPYHRPSAGIGASGGCYINFDDTYTDFPANDDNSLGPISLPFTFSLYGNTYTSLYLNNNGNITFNAPLNVYTSSGFPISTPMVAAFWGDVMTTTGATAKYKVFAHKFIATWSNVGYYNAHYDQTDSFQLIITDGTDPLIGLGNNVAFHYAQMNWTTGDVSGGTGGFGGTPATVGINAGDGTNFVQVGRFGVNSSDYTGSASTISNGVHYLEYNCFAFNASGAGNIPPSVSGLPPGNVDTIMCGTTHTYVANWLGPETDQNDSSVVDTGDLCYMTVHQTPGFTSVSRDTISITGAACNMGVHHFYITGYDDHGGITVDTITIVVVPFVPAPASNTPVCGGNTLNLSSAADGSGALYSWTGPGGFTSSMQNPSITGATPGASGTYSLTVTTPGGCSSSGATTVTVYPAASATVSASGPVSFCAGGSVSLTVTGGTSQTWSTGATTSAITVSTADTYTATVVDANGCTAVSAPVTVTVNPMPTAISGPSSVCVGATITLSDSTSGGFWHTDSSGSAIAFVSESGVVAGIAAGTVTVTYSLGACSVTYVVTVSPTPVISGATFVCSGYTTTLSASVSGGTWSSSSSTIAAISSSGVVTGLATGSVTISYILSGGCSAASVMSVGSSAGITATSSSACVGATLSLAAGTGGSWSSSNTAVATVSTSGIVTGVSAGTASITFTSGSGCTSALVVTILPNPAAITGTAVLCAGSTSILSDITPGTSWTSGTTSVATIGITSGLLTAIAAGTSVITYTGTNGCKTTTVATVNPAVASISGPSSVCAGSSISLTNTSSGSWSTGSATIATVSTTGSVTGVAAGTAVISFTAGTGCYAVKVVSVVALPAAITGLINLCIGSTTTLSTTSTGGTWSSADNAIATITGSGSVSAVSAGTVLISYTGTTGCVRTTIVTVNAGLPAITGSTSICIGVPSTLSDGVAGGAWSSSSTSVVTINSVTGVLNGVSSGSATISYNLGAGCYTTTMVVVNSAPATIAGPAFVCAGSSIMLTDGTTGGSWISSNPSLATVDASGVVTGITAGSLVISYSVSGCFITKSIVVRPVPAAIGGTMNVCVGATATLTDATSGGLSWTSSTTSVATVGSSTGIVTGIVAGTANITYTLTNTCYTTSVVTVNALPPAITGAASVCIGATTSLAVAATSGSWTSGTTTIATIGSSTGVVAGVAAGTSRITFTNTQGCKSTLVVTVVALPNVITGTTTVCLGSTSALSTTSTGGAWSSSDSATASIGSTGIVTGNAIGTALISYTSAAGCVRTAIVSVNTGVPEITGSSAVCVGKTTALTDVTTGGTWSSGSTAIATITSAGIVTGVAAGSVNITYTLTAGCRAIKPMTVNAVVATITGTTSVCINASITLTSADAGGTWTSSNTAMGTVDASSGIVTGLAAGTINITYTLATGCFTTKSITVKALPAAIGGASSVCEGLTTTLTDVTGGGVSWTSSTPSVATIATSTALVTGISAGTTIITYTVSTGCSITKIFTVNAQPSAITGTPSLCIGSSTSLSVTSASGGSWTSGTTTIASVTSTGMVNGIAAGTARITFTSTEGCLSTLVVTVSPLPNVITGTTTVCVGSTTALNTTSTGGAWSSGDTSIATAGSTGIVTGMATGTVLISYTSAAGCSRSATVTVNSGVTATTGSNAVCVGKTTALSNATTGGTWSSSSTAIANITTAGVVTGLSAGVVNITYTLTAGCKNIFAMTVNPAVSTISGSNSVCIGATGTLTTGSTGGTWTSGNVTLATIDGTSGVLTGLSAGTVLMSYILPTGCFATYPVIIKALPAAIGGATTLCVGGTTTLTDATSGGVSWTSSDVSVAAIGSSSGIVTGIGSGTASITYLISTGCSTTTTVTVNPGAAITSTALVCTGSTISMSATTPGGTWSSSAPSTASVTSTGLLTGNVAGTAVISYSLGAGCTVTQIVTVNATPAAITGTTTICVGSTGTLNSVTTGGAWTSSDGATASVSSTGVVTGNATGTATISYTTAAGCMQTALVTITTGVADISGSGPLCIGSTLTLTDATTGGSWSSSNTGVATVTSAGGLVTGVAAGTSNITYAVTAGCRSILTVTVGTSAGSISGPATVCAGSAITLSTTGTGGTWTSGDMSLATVDATGIVTGVAAGTVMISYTLPGGCAAGYAVVVKALPAAISGAANVCVGSTSLFTDATSGGVSWISSDTTVATIGVTSGILTGIAAGNATITYTISSGCSVTTAVTINSLPAAISGTLTVCQASFTALSSTSAGGTWSTANPSVATVSISGIVTGVAPGAAIISYSLGGSCVTTAVVTVNSIPAVITGTTTICAGSTTALADATTGGVWSSADGSIATVTSGGVVTGVGAGVTNISYTIGTGCARTAAVTISAPASEITGITTVCVGSTTALSDSTSGGTWSSSNTAIAATSGSLITGVATGTATITYMLAPGCSATTVVTVNPALASITGTVVMTVGGTSALSDATSGGVWSSSNTTQATINATGVVTALAVGHPVISYTLGACVSYVITTINPAVLPIAGTLAICIGGTSMLTDATSGGLSWSSSNTAVATIGLTSGIVTGIAAGTATITYATTSGTNVTAVVTVSAMPPAITGPSTACVGFPITKADATTGGVWSTSTATYGTIDAVSGVFTGIATGTSIVSYNAGGCIRTSSVTVNAIPAAITGVTSICTGSTSAFADVTTGGTWSSADATVASIVSTTGVATGVAPGSTSISYTLSATGCSRVQTVTVSTPASNGGGSGLCVGAATTLTNATTGGAWSSSNTSIATIVSTTGVATGVAIGAVNLTYTLSAGCKVITNATVNPAAAAITGTAYACLGYTTSLSDASSGGAWTSSNTSLATVTSGGVVTGLAVGTPVITYTLPTGCFKTLSVPVKALPAAISGSAISCVGSTTTFTDATTPGLSWSSSNTAVGTIVATSGVLTAISAGVTTITYTAGTGCFITRVQTVNTAGSISGPTSVSIAATAITPALYTDAVTGGVWSTSNASRATIDIAGNLTGHAAGPLNVLYTASGCTIGMAITVTSPRGSGNIASDDRLSSIQLYPNPTSGVFSISSESEGTLTVFTVDGKMLVRYDVVKGIANISLPAGLAAGTYMCRFAGADGGSAFVQLVYNP